MVIWLGVALKKLMLRAFSSVDDINWICMYIDNLNIGYLFRWPQFIFPRKISLQGLRKLQKVQVLSNSHIIYLGINRVTGIKTTIDINSREPCTVKFNILTDVFLSIFLCSSKCCSSDASIWVRDLQAKSYSGSTPSWGTIHPESSASDQSKASSKCLKTKLTSEILPANTSSINVIYTIQPMYHYETCQKKHTRR